MNIATRSVSMWPASASSAIESIHNAVVSSMTKKTVRIAAAASIRLTRVSLPRDHDLHPCQQYMRKSACIATGRQRTRRT